MSGVKMEHNSDGVSFTFDPTEFYKQYPNGNPMVFHIGGPAPVEVSIRARQDDELEAGEIC